MSVAVQNEFNPDLDRYMTKLGQAARVAAAELAAADTRSKNMALVNIADAVDAHRGDILQANREDLDAAGNNQISHAMLERLELNTARIDAMIEGLRQVAELPDPVGEISELQLRPTGIRIGKMRVPLGVIGIIYESRPNVTVDAAALCLKSGNASILRGGKEALHSNQAIYRCIQDGLAQSELHESTVQVINTADRAAVGLMLNMSGAIDVIIPRGGRSLIERIAEESTIPVIKHLDGNCHVYIDDQADPKKAIDIAINAKTRRYGVCNAMETLLVAEPIAAQVMPGVINGMLAQGVELRGCELSRQFDADHIAAAAEVDWFTEFLAPVLAIKIVDGLEQAIRHINYYGSNHTDAIISENESHAQDFLRQVDSSSVIVNASTGFADGFEYGLGAEIGISTDKLHVRGPVGLEGLTSQKYVVFGDGQIRE